MDVQSASTHVEETLDVEAFIAEHKLTAVADLQVEAHGGMYTVQEAIAECPPFAQMITSLVTTLEGIPDAHERIEKTIKGMAPTTPLPTEAKKK